MFELVSESLFSQTGVSVTDCLASWFFVVLSIFCQKLITVPCFFDKNAKLLEQGPVVTQSCCRFFPVSSQYFPRSGYPVMLSFHHPRGVSVNFENFVRVNSRLSMLTFCHLAKVSFKSDESYFDNNLLLQMRWWLNNLKNHLTDSQGNSELPGKAFPKQLRFLLLGRQKLSFIDSRWTLLEVSNKKSDNTTTTKTLQSWQKSQKLEVEKLKLITFEHELSLYFYLATGKFYVMPSLNLISVEKLQNFSERAESFCRYGLVVNYVNF